MSTHNIGFYEDLTKIIFELSSNTHLISSAEIEGSLLKPVQFFFFFTLGESVQFGSVVKPLFF